MMQKLVKEADDEKAKLLVSLGKGSVRRCEVLIHALLLDRRQTCCCSPSWMRAPYPRCAKRRECWLEKSVMFCVRRRIVYSVSRRRLSLSRVSWRASRCSLLKQRCLSLLHTLSDHVSCTHEWCCQLVIVEEKCAREGMHQEVRAELLFCSSTLWS
jgi:hypothetical protein